LGTPPRHKPIILLDLRYPVNTKRGCNRTPAPPANQAGFPNREVYQMLAPIGPLRGPNGSRTSRVDTQLIWGHRTFAWPGRFPTARPLTGLPAVTRVLHRPGADAGVEPGKQKLIVCQRVEVFGSAPGR